MSQALLERLLTQAGAQNDSDLSVLQKVGVRQLARAFDQMAQGESAEAVLAALKRSVIGGAAPSSPTSAPNSRGRTKPKPKPAAPLPPVDEKSVPNPAIKSAPKGVAKAPEGVGVKEATAKVTGKEPGSPESETASGSSVSGDFSEVSLWDPARVQSSRVKIMESLVEDPNDSLTPEEAEGRRETIRERRATDRSKMYQRLQAEWKRRASQTDEPAPQPPVVDAEEEELEIEAELLEQCQEEALDILLEDLSEKIQPVVMGSRAAAQYGVLQAALIPELTELGLESCLDHVGTLMAHRLGVPPPSKSLTETSPKRVGRVVGSKGGQKSPRSNKSTASQGAEAIGSDIGSQSGFSPPHSPMSPPPPPDDDMEDPTTEDEELELSPEEIAALEAEIEAQEDGQEKHADGADEEAMEDEDPEISPEEMAWLEAQAEEMELSPEEEEWLKQAEEEWERENAAEDGEGEEEELQIDEDELMAEVERELAANGGVPRTPSQPGSPLSKRIPQSPLSKGKRPIKIASGSDSDTAEAEGQKAKRAKMASIGSSGSHSSVASETQTDFQEYDHRTAIHAEGSTSTTTRSQPSGSVIRRMEAAFGPDVTAVPSEAKGKQRVRYDPDPNQWLEDATLAEVLRLSAEEAARGKVHSYSPRDFGTDALSRQTSHSTSSVGSITPARSPPQSPLPVSVPVTPSPARPIYTPSKPASSGRGSTPPPSRASTQGTSDLPGTDLQNGTHTWDIAKLPHPRFLVASFKAVDLEHKRRLWILDFFSRSFRVYNSNQKLMQEHKAVQLLQLEKHVTHSRRLRLMFIDCTQSYDIILSSAAEREYFYELASAMRPAIRVWCPELCPPDHLAGTAILTGTADLGSSGVKMAARSVSGTASINVARLPSEDVSVWCGTWNMEGQRPDPARLRDWIPSDAYDVYAVGCQDVHWQGRESEWFEMIQRLLGADYFTLATMVLWNMNLILLTRKVHLLKVANVAGAPAPVGAMSKAGQYGAVAVSLRFLNTSMCFVNAHLPDRAERGELRKRVLSDVFESLRLGNRDWGFEQQFHYVFLMGGLNYRVESDLSTSLSLVGEGRYGALLAWDQLKQQQHQGALLTSFTEADIGFPPTHPLERGGMEYTKETQRVPSYCDRILYSALPGMFVENLSYTMCEALRTSQHLPVSGAFRIEAQRPFLGIFTAQRAAPQLVFESIEVVENSSKVERAVVLLYSDIAESPISTSIKRLQAIEGTDVRQSQWLGRECPQLQPFTAQLDYLNQQHVWLVLRDAAAQAPLGFCGSAVLSLGSVEIGCRCTKELPLMRYSRRVGTVTVTLHYNMAARR